MVRHGVRVPDDFAIVGYDDIDFAAAAAVPLSSVRKPRQELGRRAAELLIDEARGREPPARAAGLRAGARRARVQHGPPSPHADRRGDGMRVALFATCLVDTMVPQVAQATAVLLERLGHEVVVPPGQTCCGQMHVNTGYRREAVPIVANHVRAFAGAEAIVAPSGSCVGLDPPPAGRRGAAGRRARAGRRGRRAGRAHLRAVRVPGRRPRRHRRRRLLPAPGHLPPDLPLAAAAAGRRPAAAAAARRPRARPGRAARPPTSAAASAARSR